MRAASFSSRAGAWTAGVRLSSFDSRDRYAVGNLEDTARVRETRGVLESS